MILLPEALKKTGIFHYHFTEVINGNVPFKFAHKRTHLPWMTVELKRLIRKKQRVYNRMKSYHRENDQTEYKMLQKQVSQVLKSQHKSYITNIMSSTNDKKPFWQYIKTKRQENVGVNTLKSTDEKAFAMHLKKLIFLINISNQCLLLKTLIPSLANQILHIHPWLIFKSLLREYTTYYKI